MLPSNRLPLLPHYQHWVEQWVMTEPEAQHLQFLMEAAMESEELHAPPQLDRVLQNLALHGLLDAETATRH